MSIFFSPDHPKSIDKHTGRLIRAKTSRSLRPFSQEKDNTILFKNRQYLRNSHVVRECSPLKRIKRSFDQFVAMFAEFNRQNGPEITGNYMSHNFLQFKTAFEPFVLYATHYFNSAEHTHAVRRYSPLLQFSAKVLREWAILVSTMNQFALSEVLPHLYVLQKDFEMLNDDVSLISRSVINRAYYRDTLFSASNYLKHQITTIYQSVYNVFAHEKDKGINKAQLNSLKQQVVLLSRDINENFLSLFPSNMTATPEMTRAKTHMKAACGDIVIIMDAGYFFRRRMSKIQDQMIEFHNELCALLERVGVNYEIDVRPIGGTKQTFNLLNQTYTDDSDSIKSNEDVNEMVDDIGAMLNIDVTAETTTKEKLGTIKKNLKNNSRTYSQTSSLSRVRIPPPINSARKFSNTTNTPRRSKYSKLNADPKLHTTPNLSPPETKRDESKIDDDKGYEHKSEKSKKEFSQTLTAKANLNNIPDKNSIGKQQFSKTQPNTPAIKNNSDSVKSPPGSARSNKSNESKNSVDLADIIQSPPDSPRSVSSIKSNSSNKSNKSNTSNHSNKSNKSNTSNHSNKSNKSNQSNDYHKSDKSEGSQNRISSVNDNKGQSAESTQKLDLSEDFDISGSDF